MKQCPTCSRTYADDTLRFCLDDGSALISGFDPQATLRIPSMRATDIPQTVASPVIRERTDHRLQVYLLIALLSLILGGGLVALIILGYNRTTPSSTSVDQPRETGSSLPQRSAALPTPTPSPRPNADSLVGVWHTEVYEYKQHVEILWTLRSDATSDYVFKYSDGSRGTSSSTWRYSDDTIFEQFDKGGSGQGSVRWIDADTFELSIVDNGQPGYTGVKRLYRRIGKAP